MISKCNVFDKINNCMNIDMGK